jgi:hypothetical protein
MSSQTTRSVGQFCCASSAVGKLASGSAEGAAIAKPGNSRVIKARDDGNRRTVATGIEQRPYLGGEVGKWDHTAKRGLAPDRLPHLKISPDLSRVRVELQFLEKPILPTRISDGTLARLWTGEDRYLDPAIIVDPLNPPFFRESRSGKNYCSLWHRRNFPMPKLTRVPHMLPTERWISLWILPSLCPAIGPSALPTVGFA